MNRGVLLTVYASHFACGIRLVITTKIDDLHMAGCCFASLRVIWILVVFCSTAYKCHMIGVVREQFLGVNDMICSTYQCKTCINRFLAKFC